MREGEGEGARGMGDWMVNLRGGGWKERREGK